MSTTYAACEKCGQVNKFDPATGKAPICGKCQSALPVHGTLIEGNETSLAKLIAKSPLPVVVDVWASWCGPCRQFAPAFEHASQQLGGKFVFAKLNSEQNTQLPNQWGIRGIPCILVFKNGKEVTRLGGALPQDDFMAWLKQVPV